MTSTLPQDPYFQTTADGDLVGLTYLALDEVKEIDRVRDASAGAICTFVGTTRDNFEEKTVSLLEYEAYTSMAMKTMSRIVSEARAHASQGLFSFDWPNYPEPSTSARPKPPTAHLTAQAISDPKTRASKPSSSCRLTRISLIHRLGVVPPKESSISICVSSPHRKEAFKACEWILEEVKKRVEVWKREVYESREGEEDKSWKENFPKT